MRHFLLAFLIGCSISAIAQASYPPFAPVGAEWNYSQAILGGGGGMTTVTISSQATGTTSTGVNYSRIDGFYAYRDSLKMYYSLDTVEWVLLYDFTTAVGDSFATAYYDGFHHQFDTFYVEVTEKGDTAIGGKILPYMKMQSLNGMYEFCGTAVLNIGNLNTYFLPQYSLADPVIGQLRCYTDQVHPVIISSPCDTTIIIGIDDREIVEGISIFPNPADEFLQIQFEKPISGVVELLNMQGQLVQSISFEDKDELEINTSGIPRSIYLVKIRIGGTKYVKKLLLN